MNNIHTTSNSELAGAAAEKLAAAGSAVDSHASLIGFDGFIDTIYHAVDTRQSATEYTRIPTLEAFGQRIVAAAGKSTNVEIVPQDVKLGGNGPIMANAMASFGVPVTYCGMTGYPNVHDVFREFAARARQLSVADPALTDAYEFDDGKLIVGKHATVADISYENIKARIGESQWRMAWNESRFIAMVNWTMLPHLTALWKHIQADFNDNGGDRKTLFFDLADPEKRTHEDILDALQTISAFQEHHDVVLGLNEKEGIHVAVALEVPVSIQAGKADETMIANLAAAIREKLGISVCVVHPTQFAGAASADGMAVVQGPYTPKPKISTGAGDHFNAGFCLGQIAGCDLAQSLQIGVATSGFYVRNALSPSRAQLIDFLRTL
ncbi:MAG TPA: hypothetical protein VF719_07605 [Abditibacteriaceae bacterium]|jgi:hypothetical protein